MGEIISPLITTAAVLMRLLLCYISCLVLIQSKKKKKDNYTQRLTTRKKAWIKNPGKHICVSLTSAIEVKSIEVNRWFVQV